MSRWYPVFVGGLLIVLGLGTVPASAQKQQRQQQYVSPFTAKEIEIINREYQINPEPEVLTYGGIPWMPTNVIRTGGSGADRWALFDLGKDKSGNQYRLHSKERIVRFGPFRERSEYPFVQVFFANPAARGGVARRHVLLSVGCRTFFANRGSGSPSPQETAVIAFEDFDSSGKLISTRTLSILESDQLTARGAMSHHAAMYCRAVHSYPKLVEMLMRGQQRKVPSNPSIYEIP